ncbi:MAG TPA: outer membrane lipoprotein-sorting protein [Candidatus Binatia bacterium]
MKRAALLLVPLLLCAAPELSLAAAHEPPGAALFGASYASIFQRPFYASAALSIRRADVSRRLVLGLHYRDRTRSLVRVTGSAREMGTVILRKNERIYIFFPRADLLLNLPPLMSAFPLFGSDFSSDDLLAFADFGARFTVHRDGEENLSGISSLRYRLAPHAGTTSPYSEIRLWVGRDGKQPLREEFISPEGKVLREVVMESDSRLPFPARWRARTFGPRGGESELQFRFFERDPPTSDALFTVEGLRQWR